MDQRLVDELSMQVNGKELGESVHPLPFSHLLGYHIKGEKEGSREVPEPFFLHLTKK